MLDRFVRLCEIGARPGEEREVADAVLDELRELGIDVAEDAAATPAQAAAGNLIARVPGTGDGWVTFFSHLDTVPHEGPIEVVRENGDFRSRGDTILGADNKAAVTVLMELAARHTGARRRWGSSWCSPSPRRTGCGVRRSWTSASLRAPFGFVLDHASPIGEVITAAPTYKRLIAEFTGQEAHAGIDPRTATARSPLRAAAVAGMELGRLDEETTANVGMIEGGTASNVVAGHCRTWARPGALDGERAGDDDRRDGGRVHVGGGRAELRRRRPGDRDVPRLPARHESAAGGHRAEAFGGPVTSRARSRPAGAATPTPWSPLGSRPSCWPTGPRRTTLPRSGSRRPRSWRCSASARRIEEAAKAVATPGGG